MTLTLVALVASPKMYFSIPLFTPLMALLSLARIQEFKKVQVVGSIEVML